jgi:hypothetical protein
MTPQASLDGVGSGDANQPDTPSDKDDSSEESAGQSESDPYEHIKYLDVDSLKLIKGLAGTISSVEEAEKFIQAEEKRWCRNDVLRILRARKEDLTSEESVLRWRF